MGPRLHLPHLPTAGHAWGHSWPNPARPEVLCGKDETGPGWVEKTCCRDGMYRRPDFGSTERGASPATGERGCASPARLQPTHAITGKCERPDPASPKRLVQQPGFLPLGTPLKFIVISFLCYSDCPVHSQVPPRLRHHVALPLPLCSQKQEATLAGLNTLRLQGTQW